MEIHNLIKNYKSEGFKITNNLRGASFLEELNSNDQLEYIESDNGLFFIDKSKDVFHLYYYINLNKEFDIRPLINKECIIEIIDKNNNRRNENQVNYWENNGFSLLSENVEMVFKESKINYKCKIDLDIPEEKDYEDIISLYKTGLDPVINSYPSYDEYVNLVDKKEIYIYKKENKIVAAITKKEYSNHYLLSHIIVDSNCRGMGIGIDLIMRMLENTDKKILLWVSKDNLNAIRIYEKIGFKYTDKISVQLIGGMKK